MCGGALYSGRDLGILLVVPDIRVVERVPSAPSFVLFLPICVLGCVY